MEKIYKIKKAAGGIEGMTYSQICHALGFTPICRFVEITNHWTISFTVGKPLEIKSLLSACRDAGFVPSKRLLEASKH